MYSTDGFIGSLLASTWDSSQEIVEEKFEDGENSAEKSSEDGPNTSIPPTEETLNPGAEGELAEVNL